VTISFSNNILHHGVSKYLYAYFPGYFQRNVRFSPPAADPPPLKDSRKRANNTTEFSNYSSANCFRPVSRKWVRTLFREISISLVGGNKAHSSWTVVPNCSVCRAVVRVQTV